MIARRPISTSLPRLLRCPPPPPLALRRLLSTQPPLPPPPSASAVAPACFGAGVTGGTLGGLIGLGGGVVMVPLMTAFAGLTQHQAVGTSSVAVAAVGLSACASFGSSGAVDFPAAAAVAATAMLGARLGARLTSRFDAIQLQRIFAVFQLCVAPMVPAKAMLVKDAKAADTTGGAAAATSAAAATPLGAVGGYRLLLEQMAAEWRRDRFWKELAEPVPAALELLDRADASAAAGDAAAAASQLCEAVAILDELNGTLAKIVENVNQFGAEHRLLTTVLERIDPTRQDKGVAQTMREAFEPARLWVRRYELGSLLCVGVGCGVAAGMFGIGGGVIVTPSLCLLTDMPYVTVLGTTLTSMVPPGLVSGATHHRLGNVIWLAAVPLCVGSAAGAFAGGQLAVRVPEEPLQWLFAAFIGGTGARKLWMLRGM